MSGILKKAVVGLLLFAFAVAVSSCSVVSLAATGVPGGASLAAGASHPAGSTQTTGLAEDGEGPKSTLVAGRVLGPGGEPAAGARVVIWSGGKAGPQTKAGPGGRFQLDVPADQIGQGAKLVATAAGFGPDWIAVQARWKGEEVTLRLPRDEPPVSGRILDLEGKPVAGATVKVLSVERPARGDLTAWFDALKPGALIEDLAPELPRLDGAALGRPAELTTDKDGRFRLSGIGRERLVGLRVKGVGIEQMQLYAATREKVPPGTRGGNHGTYPATFDLLVGPGRSISGTVREKGTGKPLPAITVASSGPVYIEAVTDREGRYRIDGVGKHAEYQVSGGGKLPYFKCASEVADKPGLQPLVVDLELVKGAVIRGRLTDKATGRPVRGEVAYSPLADNPNLKHFAEINKPRSLIGDRSRVARDGSFEVLALPGPGAIGVIAEPLDRYSRRVAPAITRQSLGGPRRLEFFLESCHAAVPVDADPDRPKSLTCEIALDPARILAGTVVDADGKAVPGTYAAGLLPVVEGYCHHVEPLKQGAFRIVDPDARPVLFVHPGRKLARLLLVDESTPPTVRLDPTGSLRGRIVTGDEQKPRAGVKVTARPSRRLEHYGKGVPLEVITNFPGWNKVLKAEATTDGEGRFHLDGLVPGLKYRIALGDGARLSGPQTEAVTVGSGKTTDAGTLKSGPPPK